jgi:hypothetical protein
VGENIHLKRNETGKWNYDKKKKEALLVIILLDQATLIKKSQNAFSSKFLSGYLLIVKDLLVYCTIFQKNVMGAIEIRGWLRTV